MCDDLWTANARIAEPEAEVEFLRNQREANAITLHARVSSLRECRKRIVLLEAVAYAAEVVYAEWGEEEIACEFEEWRNLRSALDATNCDIKRGGAK